MNSVLFWIISLATLIGIYAACRYGRKTKQFRWIEFWALLAPPIIWSFALAYFYGTDIFALFAASMVVGIVLEYGLGRAYHQTLNKRLWTYTRYSIGGYTSWLTLPMWGVAGVIFWSLGKVIGL